MHTLNAKRRKPFASAVLIIGLLALGGYAVYGEVSCARLKDPTGISTVVDFYDRFHVSSRASILHVDNAEYFCLYGPLPPRWSLAVPSSPPVYLFDDEGKFVDWCSDPGDHPSWNQKWMTNRGVPLSDSEVRNRLELD